MNRTTNDAIGPKRGESVTTNSPGDSNDASLVQDAKLVDTTGHYWYMDVPRNTVCQAEFEDSRIDHMRVAILNYFPTEQAAHERLAQLVDTSGQYQERS